MGLFSRLRSAPHRRSIKTVLIVEDEPLVAFDNEHALAHAGYHVTATVDRCALAIEVMAQERVDLVVADIRLTGQRSGIDVARHAQTLDIPVLLSTGDCPPEAAEVAAGWLAKPHDPRDLVRAIQAIEALISGEALPDVPVGFTIFDDPGPKT